MTQEGQKYSERGIAALLEDYVRSHAVGVRLPTAAQLAEKYGVSAKTANRAVTRLVRKNMVSRVRGRGSFIRSNIDPGQKLRVAVFLQRYRLENPLLDYAAFDYFTDCLKTGLNEGGFRPEFFLEGAEDNSLKYLNLDKFDALILAAGFQNKAGEALKRFRGQLILINDDQVNPGPWHQVIYDYRPGFGKALDYLLNKGFERFFVAGMAGAEISNRRYQALSDEAMTRGIPADKVIFYKGDGGPLRITAMAGRDCGKYYLEHHREGTAIISLSDYLSVGILDVLREQCLTPGRDVSLISYDNLEGRMPEQKLGLNLCAITHPLKEAVTAGVKMLDELIHQPRNDEFLRIYVVPASELVSGASA